MLGGKITRGLWVFRGFLREMTDVNALSGERTLLGTNEKSQGTRVGW